VHTQSEARADPVSGQFVTFPGAGVLVGESAADARLRCRLHADYLAQRLG
jgi:hypothetical protein